MNTEQERNKNVKEKIQIMHAFQIKTIKEREKQNYLHLLNSGDYALKTFFFFI